jgi:hypothetical protein
MKNLIGKKVDPALLPLGWDEEETDDGIEIQGSTPANRSLGDDELLEEGCIQIGGGTGPPVILSMTLSLDRDYTITDVDLYAYASHGPQYGRPIDLIPTDEDEALAEATIGRFLDPPEIVPGLLVEDQVWLGGIIDRFQELAQSIHKLEGFFDGYIGRPIDKSALAPLGWDVEASFNGNPSCQGYIELITDMPARFFMAIELTPSKEGKIETIRWFLKEDEPPVAEDWDYPNCDGLVEGFNRLRLERIMEAATGQTR